LGIENKQEASKQNGYGIRAAYTVVNVWAAELAITGTYHPQSKGDFIQDLSPNPPQHFGSYKTQYIALGAQLEWKRLIDLHAGVDVRQEKLSAAALDTSTHYTRPWISAGFGYSIPLSVVKPFVRLEAAYALSHKDLGGTWNEDDLLKAMAPRYQVGIYAGINF
jgi:hypothetical protein